MVRTIAAAALLVGATQLAGCDTGVQDPWVSSEAKAERLGDERTRTSDQRQALAHRLERYGRAYQ